MTAPKHSASYPTAMIEALLTASSGDVITFELSTIKKAQALRAMFYSLRRVLYNEKSEHAMAALSVRLRVIGSTLQLESAAEFSSSEVQAAVTAGLRQHAEKCLAKTPPSVATATEESHEYRIPDESEGEEREEAFPLFPGNPAPESSRAQIFREVPAPKKLPPPAPRVEAIPLNFPPKA